MKTLTRYVVTRLLVLLLSISAAFAQDGPPAQGRPAFSQPELDQMLAPVALYPDSLLSQILMASTYPLEVVEAARWSRARPGLEGDAAVRAAEPQNWDPSVKSLVAFPQILAMMDEKLDWTEQLGDAFVAQEPQVMDTVQSLRQKAYAAGNLRSTDKIRVAEEGETIIVEPVSPQVVYVPYYDPLVVYGPWWWPAYPPVYWAPWPGYHVRPGYAGYAWGSGITVSAGFFFGAFDWHRHHVNVVRINNYYTTVNVNRQADSGRRTNPAPIAHGPMVWRHDPARDRGASHREAPSRHAHSRAEALPGAPRDFRGRAPSPPASNEPRGVRPQGHDRPAAQSYRSVPRPDAGRVTTWREAQRDPGMRFGTSGYGMHGNAGSRPPDAGPGNVRRIPEHRTAPPGRPLPAAASMARSDAGGLRNGGNGGHRVAAPPGSEPRAHREASHGNRPPHGEQVRSRH